MTSWYRFLFFLVVLLFNSTEAKTFVRDSLIDYSRIDAHARQVPKAIRQNAPKTVEFLIEPARNDFEKARSLFIWVAHYISFDHKAYRNGNKRLNRHVADVLSRRKAVCFGYAQLFQQLCKEAGLPCEVISGYSKRDLHETMRLDQPDHAWNAVQLTGQWYLLDVTWFSNLQERQNRFTTTYDDRYFLTDPKLFLLQHLPADPMWQLLDCPLSFQDFKTSSSVSIKDSVNCINYGDSIAQWQLLSRPEQKLQTALHAHRFHPSEANTKELTASYMDYEVSLSEIADHYQQAAQFDSLAQVQEKMIGLCRAAHSLGFLFPNQAENCAYTKINYASTLSALIQELAKKKEDQTIKSYLERMIQYLEEAKTELQLLQENYYLQQSLKQCESYLTYAREQLAYYR